MIETRKILCTLMRVTPFSGIIKWARDPSCHAKVGVGLSHL